ncbi:MAG: hypothetical protein M3Q99_19680 [Acidobacteriota bacterium]|nr:hypothetical protein [Acidobacteriota bacterium]
MKNRFLPLFLLFALSLNALGASFADVKSAVKNQSGQLVALLPASDAVMTFDAKRFMNDALPQILSGNQPMLSKILAHVDEVKAKTGIDLRQFEQVAVGVTAKQITAKEYDFEPVIVARGQINSGALLAAAKLAANGKYREEKVGGKSVFVFAAKEIAAANKPQNPTAKNGQMIDKIIGKLSQEIAVSAFDQNTLAFGTAARVRQTIESKTRVGTDIANLLNKKQSPVMNFAAKLPGGLKQFIPLDNDELGKNIDAIQYLYGSMNVVGDNTALELTAKTLTAAQAQELYETLEGLQMIGKVFLGSAKGADKQVYARMIENAKFTHAANEVKLDLQVQQSDINVLIGAKK